MGALTVSIHAPREGERRLAVESADEFGGFNPRSPRGGATALSADANCRGAVSIHAPREGERHVRCVECGAEVGVSIHAPREGERPKPAGAVCWVKMFQSTLPARGSDVAVPVDGANYERFNPRSPRGGATIACCRAPQR